MEILFILHHVSIKRKLKRKDLVSLHLIPVFWIYGLEAGLIYSFESNSASGASSLWRMLHGIEQETNLFSEWKRL